jgi:hypothetical protein
MSLNQRVIAEFSTCTPSAPQLRDLSIQTFRYLSECDPQKLAATPASPLFRKGSGGISMPQPLRNIESLENLSQIVSKGPQQRIVCH